MVDPTDKPEDLKPEHQQDNLINQIDELENLLAEKKAEAQALHKEKQTVQDSLLPRMNVGTDGIPVLVEAVTEEDLFTNENPPAIEKESNNDDQFINEIIDKIDKEITEDLDELILMLKDSIIDEVKTRLLKELKTKKDDTDDNK